MSDKQKLENERDQNVRQVSVDLATRVVGKPVYLGDNTKQHDDVVEVAEKIYAFIKGE